MKNWKKRYLEKVDCPGPDGCWKWMASKTAGGYGQFVFRGKVAGAHRVAFELWIGQIPKGLWVLHRCDNPPCCNPGHLFLGTQQDNMDDMVAKDRQLKGENHGKSKLTEAQALYAKNTDGEKTGREVAKELGVSEMAISNIRTGVTWKHLEAC